MSKIVSFIDNIVFKSWFVIASVVLLISCVVKAMYSMDDYPYFEMTTGLDLLGIGIALCFYLFIIKHNDWIEQKIPYVLLVLFFIGCGIAFVLLMPIQPISDPAKVTEGALMFANGDIDGIMASDYLQYVIKNMKVSIFYALFILPFPKTIISLRMVNVGFYILTALCCGKICKNIYKNYDKTVFIIVASFIPLILYTNQVYFDLPVLCLGTIALYFYTKERNIKNLIISLVFLAIASFLRILGAIFVIAVLVDFFCYKLKKAKPLSNRKVIILSILGIIILVFILSKSNTIFDALFRREGASTESIWTLFCMGLNEPEFGMMHNEILGAEGYRTFGDFINLLFHRSLLTNITIFGKKILWLWTQGTYQAQRYGFGYNMVNPAEKFMYNTVLVNHFMDTSFVLPSIAIRVMRSQYMALFILMIIGVFRAIKNKMYNVYRVFVLMFFGSFLILIIYEMKSRYVFHLITCMIILAVFGAQGVLKLFDSYEYRTNLLNQNKKLIKRFISIILVVLIIVSSIVAVVWKKNMDEAEKLAVEQAQRENANVYCQQSGLTIIEKNISIPNISREYEFLYIADTHAVVSSMDELPAWNTTTDSRREMFKNALGVESRAQVETWINVCNALQVDGLLLGGDIIDYGDDENIDWLKKQLSVLQAPYLYTLGNHDSFDVINDKQNHDNEKLKELFLNNDFDCAYMEYNEFIICQVDDSLNRVSQTALDKFKEVYSMGKPIILVTHVPLYTENNIDFKMTTEELRGEDRLIGYGLDYEMDEYTKEFFDLVTASDSPVKLVLDGHVHFNHEDMLNETIPQYTVGSATDGQAYLIKITQ